MGYRDLPGTLDEALHEMEALRTGRRSARRARLRLLPAQQAPEWDDYRAQVTPFELKEYLSL